MSRCCGTASSVVSQLTILVALSYSVAGCGPAGVARSVVPENHAPLDNPSVDEASLIVRATALPGGREIEAGPALRYQIVPFQVRRSYRIPPDGLSAYGPVTMKPGERDHIFVVALAYTSASEFLVPHYEPGKDYILYLEPAGLYLYSRSRDEHLQRERLWSVPSENQVIASLSTLVRPSKP